MEFTNIAALVPEGEHFDETAFVNEGAFFTKGHAQNIEQALQKAADENAAHATAVNTLTEQAQTATAAMEQATTALETANATIAQLQAENAELKAKPAHSVKETSKEKDDHGNGGDGWPETSVDKEAAYIRSLAGKK